MRFYLLSVIVILLSLLPVHAGEKDGAPATVYDLTLTSLHGQLMPLEDYRGKVILFVNTASKCGYTKQYSGLEKLSQAYKDKDFVVVGVPSNDFGNQEPGTNEEIITFCQKNYGVSFPMTEKMKVKGKDRTALYAFLTEGTDPAQQVKWNFNKFLVGRDGTSITYFPSQVAPKSGRLTDAIDQALAQQ